MGRRVVLPGVNGGEESYSTSDISLRGTGSWNDDVGNALERVAQGTVKSYNDAEEVMLKNTEALSWVKPEEYKYESRQDEIYRMKVEY